MWGLSSTTDGRKRLDRDTCDIVQRLLGSERDTGHLCVEPEHQGFRIVGCEPFADQIMP